jgi:hypothetical protein
MSKLDVDGDAIVSNRDHFVYLFTALEGKARLDMTHLVEAILEGQHEKPPIPKSIFELLDALYRNAHKATNSAAMLRSLKQDDNVPSSRLPPLFERLMAENFLLQRKRLVNL